MRNFLVAVCAIFFALAPAAIATTREDIEERKRAHAEVIYCFCPELHMNFG